jgi:hypothetical protein
VLNPFAMTASPAASDTSLTAARQPSPQALAAAAALSRRARDRSAQLRRIFAEREDVTTPTPLARMIRGGRGGEVRLKTYLSMLFIAGAPPYDVSYPARAWATLLDLPDPDTKGARRVNEAISWLEANQFVTVANNPGRPSRVTLLDESASGSRYEAPGEVYNRLRKSKGEDDARRNRYIKVSPTFWTSGWLTSLTTPAVSMYIILLCAQTRAEISEVWFSPDQADKLYSLSSDTRSRGLAELRKAGLIDVRRRALSNDVFDVQRYRNTYRLNLDRLTTVASVPQP